MIRCEATTGNPVSFRTALASGTAIPVGVAMSLTYEPRVPMATER